MNADAEHREQHGLKKADKKYDGDIKIVTLSPCGEESPD